MLCSPERGFIFIATPKTATTAIEDHLSAIDPELLRDHLPIPEGGTLTHRGTVQKVRKHAMVTDITSRLGEAAHNYTFVAFIRDPREVVLSKYYWYRNGWPAEHLQEGRISSLRRRSRRWYRPSLADRVWLARVLPVTIWALVYPFKPAAHFLCDAQGRLGVDSLGAYSRLQEDFTRIFSRFGYTQEQLILPHVNVTRYESKRISRDVLDWVVETRMRKDAELNRFAEKKGVGY